MNVNRTLVLYLTAYAVAILVRSAWRMIRGHLAPTSTSSNTNDER